jgi:hypothetical protein
VGAKPDDVITSLLAESTLMRERDALRKQVEDLDKQLILLCQ